MNTSVARRLSADELAPLTRLSGWRSAASVLHTWGVVAAAVAIAIALPSWPLVLLAVIVIATQQHALFLLAHEAVHYRLFGHRRLNDAVGQLCAGAAGISMCTYRVIHRLHHGHLYSPEDPDMALHGGYPRGKRYLLQKLLKDLCGLTAAKTYGYFFGVVAANSATGVAADPLAGTSAALRSAARADRMFVIALQAAVPLLLASFGWRALAWYAMLWLLPALTVLQAILRLRAIFEHGALTDHSSPLTAARTHLPSPTPGWWLARALLFPHHVNYHVAHHLYPAVPHYRLRQLQALMERRGLVSRADMAPLAATLRAVFADRPSPPAGN